MIETHGESISASSAIVSRESLPRLGVPPRMIEHDHPFGYVGRVPVATLRPLGHSVRMSNRLLLLSGLFASLIAAPAAAQRVGGVGNSGMGQGEARIVSRSDVRLSMESMPGTGAAAVGALGQRVGARMADLRRCYEERVEEDPTVTGTLRMRFLLENRGAPRIEMDNDGVRDRAVVQCITRVLERVESRELARPTRAIVQLVLSNTAAQGVRNAQQEAQRAQEVTITNDAQGNPTASGGTEDRRVRFTVSAQGRNARENVTAAHRALMTALPGLMDCRRRSGRGGNAPGGDLIAMLTIRRNNTPTARVTNSTVPNERTEGCVGRALDQMTHEPTEGGGRVEARIHFEPATPVEQAQP
jgi:hypothetical protein